MDGKLIVTDFTATAYGFVITFNKAVKVASIKLYGVAGSVPSLTLAGVAWQGVLTFGSVIWNAAGTQMTYLYTFGMLPDDTYTLTLVSGTDAFQDVDGVPLDGDDDGGADDYVHEFSTTYQASSVGLIVGNVCCGNGQSVDAAAPGSTALAPIFYGGIPIQLTDGNDATTVVFKLTYSTALLELTGVLADTGTKAYANAPAGSTCTRTAHVVADGIATDTFEFATNGDDLGTGAPLIIAILLGTVPNPNSPLDIYGLQQVLALSDITSDGTLSTVGVSGVHCVAYIGNATATGSYCYADAALVGRVAGLTDSGFAAFRLTDPLLLADILTEYSISAGDSALVNQKSFGIAVPSIPETPCEAALLARGAALQVEVDTAAVTAAKADILTTRTLLGIRGDYVEVAAADVRKDVLFGPSSTLRGELIVAVLVVLSVIAIGAAVAL